VAQALWIAGAERGDTTTRNPRSVKRKNKSEGASGCHLPVAVFSGEARGNYFGGFSSNRLSSSAVREGTVSGARWGSFEIFRIRFRLTWTTKDTDGEGERGSWKLGYFFPNTAGGRTCDKF